MEIDNELQQLQAEIASCRFKTRKMYASSIVKMMTHEDVYNHAHDHWEKFKNPYLARLRDPPVKKLAEGATIFIVQANHNKCPMNAVVEMSLITCQPLVIDSSTCQNQLATYDYSSVHIS